MAELKFEEDCEKQIIWVETPKRKARLKIFVPVSNIVHWRISYEDGRPVEGLSENRYTSRLFAIKAVEVWEATTKKTKDAKQYELFGDKQPPVLKRKRVPKNAARA
jgi:hypothetical protein